jgi:type IV fimbrial biogenesis protein FimT
MSPAFSATSRIPAVHPPFCTFRRGGLAALTAPLKIRAMKIRSQGMTLIELMAAIAVLGIMLALAIPSFRGITANNRTIAATNDLVTALNVARSEALRRSGNTVVCTSTNQASCSGSTDWANGWIVFADRNRNDAVDADELVQAWSAVGDGFTVGATTVNGGVAVNRVTYNTMGMGELPVGASRIRFAIVSPVCSGNKAGRTEVLITGMIQSSKVACP